MGWCYSDTGASGEALGCRAVM